MNQKDKKGVMNEIINIWKNPLFTFFSAECWNVSKSFFFVIPGWNALHCTLSWFSPKAHVKQTIERFHIKREHSKNLRFPFTIKWISNTLRVDPHAAWINRSAKIHWTKTEWCYRTKMILTSKNVRDSIEIQWNYFLWKKSVQQTPLQFKLNSFTIEIVRTKNESNTKKNAEMKEKKGKERKKTHNETSMVLCGNRETTAKIHFTAEFRCTTIYKCLPIVHLIYLLPWITNIINIQVQCANQGERKQKHLE